MSGDSEKTVEKKPERSWTRAEKAIRHLLTRKLTLDPHGDLADRSKGSPEAQTIHHLQKAEVVEEVGKDTHRPIVDLDLIGLPKA